MEAKKVLVKENDAAVITCPFCHRVKEVSVTRYKERRKRELNIKCSCKSIFNICLECRKNPRKQTKILGKSINLSKHRETQDIIIKNITMEGIGFVPLRKNRTSKNDRLLVSFTLNDTNGTQIDTPVTVRNAFKGYVGCEFDSTEKFKTSLGFYLID